MMRFAKMQAIGNDFVVVSEPDFAGQSLAAAAICLCDRHTGVGADGLLTIGPGPAGAAFHFRMFNPDGTEDMCGNGLRCAALYAVREGILPESAREFPVSTKDGVRTCRLISVGADRTHAVALVDMGAPIFDTDRIPYLGPTDNPRFEEFLLNPVNTGTAHTIIFVAGDPDEETFQSVSSTLEIHPWFPERTSVLWAWHESERGYAVRIWERSVGETLGCGTGACAVAAAAIRAGRLAFGGPTTVTSKGGSLTIDWPSADATILMTGPAQFVFSGTFPPGLQSPQTTNSHSVGRLRFT